VFLSASQALILWFVDLRSKGGRSLHHVPLYPQRLIKLGFRAHYEILTVLLQAQILVVNTGDFFQAQAHVFWVLALLHPIELEVLDREHVQLQSLQFDLWLLLLLFILF